MVVVAAEEEVVDVAVEVEVEATSKPRLEYQKVVIVAAAVEAASRAEAIVAAAAAKEDRRAAQSWRTIRTWALSMLRTGMATNEETKRS